MLHDSLQVALQIANSELVYPSSLDFVARSIDPNPNTNSVTVDRLSPDDRLLLQQRIATTQVANYSRVLKQANCLMDEVIELLERLESMESIDKINQAIDQVHDLLACTQAIFDATHPA